MNNKVVLFSTTDHNLDKFEMRYAKSPIEGCFTRIEQPLTMTEMEDGKIRFLNERGEGFLLNAVAARNDVVALLDENAETISKKGLRINTRGAEHLFYFV